MIQSFRKKPVVIQAMQWRGLADNAALSQFVGPGLYFGELSIMPYIRTLEGDMLVRHDDYVIRGVQGEHYPCQPDIFRATYEAAS